MSMSTLEKGACVTSCMFYGLAIALTVVYPSKSEPCPFAATPKTLLSSEIFSIGKELSEKMLNGDKTPSWLQWVQAQDEKGKEVVPLSNFPKLGVRVLGGSLGGLICVSSHLTDLVASVTSLCMQGFFGTELPPELQKAMDAAAQKQKDMAVEMKAKEQQMASNLADLQQAQSQESQQIVQAQENANLYAQALKKADGDVLSVIDTSLPAHAEATLKSFMEYMEQVPTHEKRVGTIRKLLAVIQSQEELNNDLEGRLQSLSTDYSDEVSRITELVSQLEEIAGGNVK